MNLKEQLKIDLKASLKSGDSVKKNIVRLVMSEIAAEDSRRNVSNKLDDAGLIAVITKIKKSLMETKALLEKEFKSTDEVVAEITVLDMYLPQLMSKEETIEAINEIIAEIGEGVVFGRVMGTFSKKYKGKADNKMASEIIKEKLV